MPNSAFSIFGFALLLGVCAWALALGAERERLAGATYLAGGVLTLAAQPLSGRYDPSLLFFLIDLGVMLVLVALAWRSPSRWPFLAIACQGVALALHLIRFVRPAMAPWTYITALALTSDGALVSLAVGTWRVRRRRRLGRRS